MKFTLGPRVRWAVVGLLALLAVFHAGMGEAVSWDISGRWLVEGSGFIEWRDVPRASLKLEGTMDIYTVESGDIWAVTSYDINLRLDATRANIKVWDDHLNEILHVQVPLPADANPSLGTPFTLPSVTTENGLTYTVTLTSVLSGTLAINGEEARLGSVGHLHIGSESALWREGTSKPGASDASSGCRASGTGVAGLALVALLLCPLRRVFCRFRVK